jgi:nucleoside-diphosphate-sugar epimerase
VNDLAILGAGGFVGSRLVESLVLDGVRGIRPVVRGYRNLAGLCRFGDAIDVRRADAESVSALTDALAGVRTVVNLTTGPPAGIVRSTEAIYESCKRAGVSRLVHLSSAVVYGDVPEPIDDDAPPVAKHWMPYARAKGASEVWLRDRLGGSVDVVVLRPGIVWGVKSPHTLGFAKSLCDKRAFLVDGGRGIFNGIYIDNLVASIRTASNATGRAAGFYNVADRELVTWRQFFDALGAPLGCEAARLPQVPGEEFPRSIASIVDTVQSLPLVNELYHRMKGYLPDALKAGIKARLEGPYGYDRHAASYATDPAVDRELWHLQRVRHKLPAARFERTFAFVPPVTFEEGVSRTVAWLRTLGWVATPAATRHPA